MNCRSGKIQKAPYPPCIEFWLCQGMGRGLWL